MWDTIGHSLSVLASSDDEVDGEDYQDLEQSYGIEDYKPSWVIGIISKTVQQRMERSQQTQIQIE
jgi:hypothetical protein